ncbi:SpoIIE family protein phosphatase [Paracrocinitomix mangrovi]|uniref:PP2C family protein-serine/threonine phosphatase n=1 Tax=Paracrocinitomix mangrovi TaxID=2862509 RepID=UPI001C8DE27D|nr:SpoIIE family protein phosphatase [Paracrocinitomix mangrovi]UKN00275.1 SpoIIE family protein phosphatase [Paracrocinitomix mangrovi]
MIKKLWRKISFLGIREDQEFDQREVVLLNKLVFISSLAIALVIPVEVILNGWELVPYEALVVIVGVITLTLNHLKWYNIARFFFFSIAIGFVFIMGVLVGSGTGNGITFFAIFAAPAMLHRDIRIIILLCAIVLGVYIALPFTQEQFQPVFDISPELKRKFNVVFKVVSMTILFFEIYYFKSINNRFQELLYRKNELIEEKNKEIIDSINYAKRIQDAYLPPISVFEHYFENAFMLFMPKDIVSGDFYWFYGTENAWEDSSKDVFVVGADCTGHGVPGALMSVICTNALNDAVINKNLRNTGSIFDDVRDHVVKILKTDKNTGRKDGMDAVICRINRAEKTVEYTGANNPLWILRKDADDIEILKSDRQPVGAFDNPQPFTSHQVKLNEGDTIYFFSDGFQDQFGGEKGKKFKAANIKKLILDNRSLNMKEQHQLLKNAFLNWRGDLEQVDDVVFTGIKF